MSEQNIVNISEANLQQTLQQSMNVPVLFYFWSARSQHCEQLTPVLERLAAQYNGQFTLAKVDCDAEQMLASQFGLRAIPTVYLFQNGQPVDGFEGPQPEEAIRALLDKVLPREVWGGDRLCMDGSSPRKQREALRGKAWGRTSRICTAGRKMRFFYDLCDEFCTILDC